ncbi:hypothetical protein E2562_028348 [Oryza meyeriana var. granulata]|uniref:Ubiquitin-like protease family profile domain-containing protein n=1 Tax=Oryza meyeriana var. granulata TaxID=110450 RepID=A0A6G1CSN4_9ORYZ|nr:hypothetical protein E2562_028348 [Oryza meyeriana var. granulata]
MYKSTRKKVNKEEGHLEGETKEGGADDRKKEQLLDAQKAEDYLEADNKNKLKNIAPARVGVYLLNNQLDKNDIKSLFRKSDDRLDHKELMGELVDNVGHWFTVCLNLKAERFEVLDSLRDEGDESLVSACNFVVASIKIMWERSIGQGAEGIFRTHNVT